MPKKLLACMAILFLSACGTRPDTPTPERERTDPSQQADISAARPDPDYWLNQARQTDDQTPAQQAYLINAATAFFDLEQWQHGGVVLSQIEPTGLRTSDALIYQIQRARLYLALEQWQEALTSLEEIEQRVTQREQRALLMEIRYKAYAGQQRYLSAARELIQLQRYSEEQYTDQIWTYLTQVPAGYWRQAVRESDEQLRGWTSLFIRITQALDHRDPLAPELQRWQTSFANHPANSKVNELLENQSWMHEQPRRIAVLLPLSGQFASQGQAVRDGVLAALSNERNEDVLFIDTQNTSPSAALARLHEENIEGVIGPLSRDYLEQFATHLKEQPQSRGWVQLWLNQAPTSFNAPGSAFFALDTDSEVEFASQQLRARGFDQALILGPDTQRGRQLSNLFERDWQNNLGPRTSRVGLYSSSADIREVIEERLHVSHSKQRITSVERAAGSIDLDSEPRSRVDLDAIYLVGDATQARLVKPFIDTNISAFAQRIPVYANSGVHEQSRDRSENDLDGITFTEAPWLLPTRNEQELFERFRNLRSNWSPSTQRLIAMGYDSMALLPRLTSMNWLPGYDHAGLTGRLRISGQTVVREFNWATFDQHQIKTESDHEYTYNRERL